MSLLDFGSVYVVLFYALEAISNIRSAHENMAVLQGGLGDTWKIVLVVVPIVVAVGVVLYVFVSRKREPRTSETSDISEDHIGMGRIVGEGSGGVVYAHKVDGQLTAVKVFTNSMHARIEKEIQQKLPEHPNIIK